jgi:hypothetical protein
MFRRFVLACASLAAVAIPRATHAQACYAPAELPDRGLSVDVTFEKATVDLDAGRGGWEGALLGASWQSRRLFARAALPFYRIDDGVDATTGTGDLLLESRVAAITRPRFAAGAGLAVGLPTGDAAAGRGMGHVMVMPGLWFAARRGRLELSLLASLGHAVGADEHHIHGRMVTVNPMSPVEVAGTARISARATDHLSPRIGASTASPIDSDAATRASALVGLAWRRDAWQVAADLEVPIAGDAFDARGTVQVARRL